jgi:protein-tyrosine-phosphatase
MEPKRILFVCVENACRSQMAEAFARQYGGERVEAYSAGSSPRGRIDPTTVAVMQEKGLDVRSQTSKGLHALPTVAWDAVVGMGCGEEACAAIPATRHVNWQIPNPAGRSLEVYRQVRDLIEGSVKTLLDQALA